MRINNMLPTDKNIQKGGVGIFEVMIAFLMAIKIRPCQIRINIKITIESI